MTTEKPTQLNNIPNDYIQMPLYSSLANFIAKNMYSEGKERIIGYCHEEAINWRRPPLSESAIRNIVERYWLWDTRIYTAPEDREWSNYWQEFRLYIRQLGIPLKDFDKATKMSAHHEMPGYQKLLIGFYLIAEDRCPSFIINACYHQITQETFSVVSEVIYPFLARQYEESIQYLRDHRDDIRVKLLNALFFNEVDTVGQASTLIQTMAYIDEDPELWIPYLTGLKSKEIIHMVQIINDSLLATILGENEIPAESEPQK